MKISVIMAIWIPWLFFQGLFGGVLGAGALVGALVTTGMFLTLGAIPGFWSLARSRAGGIFLAVVTALATHIILGKSTAVTAIIAIGYAFLAKQMALGAYRAWHQSQAGA